MDHVHSERACMALGSITGLGLAYANSKRETVVKEEEGGVIFELKKVSLARATRPYFEFEGSCRYSRVRDQRD